jgi:flagellar protein FliO/FliZ
MLGTATQLLAMTAFADAPAAATGRPFASPDAVGQPITPSATGLGQVTLALLLVLVAVFAVAWVVKRMRALGSRVGDAIDVVAEIPLGQRERAVLLKVGQTQILVGVAPGQVNTLHILTEPIDLSKPQPPATPNDPRANFKSILLRSLGK